MRMSMPLTRSTLTDQLTAAAPFGLCRPDLDQVRDANHSFDFAGKVFRSLAFEAPVGFAFEGGPGVFHR